MEKGLIQVYTGDGKGKTTSAIGQGVRASGRGYKVYFVQFLKGGETGELISLKNLEPNFQVFRFEKDRDFVWNLRDFEIELLKQEINDAYIFILDTLKFSKCDLLILDEIMAVLKYGFIDTVEFIAALKNKPKEMEIVLTGRNVPQGIIEISDYVSDIRSIKHPFQKGIEARLGIEY